MMKPRRRRGRSSNTRWLLYLIAGAVALAGSLAVGLVVAKRVRTGKWEPPTLDDVVWVKVRIEEQLGKKRPPAKVIYLNRGKLDIRGGQTDSHENSSRIVSESENDVAHLPGFSSSNRRWKSIVACVKTLFAPYDVKITDTRPQARGYVMVMVGGRERDLGGFGDHHSHGKVGGLAPFNGSAIGDPIVFAFSRTLRNRTRAVCETIGMEVAHSYGLDHSYECKDVMTYKRGCKKSFLDKDVRCGENKPRTCQPDGTSTQNSHQYLLEVLGPREK